MTITINQVKETEVSDFAQFCTQYFNSLAFKQVHLYSAIDYFIQNANYIALPNNKFLRSNTEPDIWENSEDDQPFFAITSLFRLEDKNSPIHKQEFKIVDFYSYDCNAELIIAHIFKIITAWEEHTGSGRLTSLEKFNISYQDFVNNRFDHSSPRIYFVSGYPREETFFDGVDKKGVPLKSELFFVWKDMNIEFAVLGKVGPNVNPRNYIADYEYLKKDRNLWGGGIGLERLLLIYHILNSLL